VGTEGAAYASAGVAAFQVGGLSGLATFLAPGLQNVGNALVEASGGPPSSSALGYSDDVAEALAVGSAAAKATGSPIAGAEASLTKWASSHGLNLADDTAARLDIAGASLFGRNAHDLAIDFPINPVSAGHAEAEAFQQARSLGLSSDSAVLYVTRPLCGSCGKGVTGGGFGVSSMMKATGVKALTIITPEGISIMRVAPMGPSTLTQVLVP
jgi:hypothetical protein